MTTVADDDLHFRTRTWQPAGRCRDRHSPDHHGRRSTPASRSRGGDPLRLPVAVIGLPADPHWHRGGHPAVGPRRFGYDMDYRPVEGLWHDPNRPAWWARLRWDRSRRVHADVVVDGDRIVSAGPPQAMVPRVVNGRAATPGAPAAPAAPVTPSSMSPGCSSLPADRLSRSLVFDGMDLLRVQGRPFSMEFFRRPSSPAAPRERVTTIRDAGAPTSASRRRWRQSSSARGWRSPSRPSARPAARRWLERRRQPAAVGPHPGRPDCVVDGVEDMRKRVRECRAAPTSLRSVPPASDVHSR